MTSPMVVDRIAHASIHQLTDQITLKEVVWKPELYSARLIQSLQVFPVESDVKASKVVLEL